MHKKENSVVLFSTITKAIVELENNKYNNIFLLSDDEIKKLKDMNILVDDHLDEKKYVWHIINKDRLNPISFACYVMFTEECNFRCKYCYQNNQVKNRTLNKKKMHTIIRWISMRLKKNNYKYCRIDLYGGEPLLNKEMMIDFSRKIYDECIKNNIELRLSLVTNGFLLTNETVETLLHLGLRSIQISFDGFKDDHDFRRPLKDCSGTFDKIMANIINLQNMNVEIILRIGFDKYNLDSIPDLIIYLKKVLDLNKIEIYFAPIYQTTAQIANKDSFCSNYVLNTNRSLIDAYKFLYKTSYDLGIKVPSYIKIGPCMVLADDAIIFDTDGNIFKCVDMIGISELIIGNADMDNYLSKYYDFIMGETLNNCINRGCKFVPLCGGGCAMVGYTKEKKINEIDCKVEVFNEVNKYLLSLL